MKKNIKKILSVLLAVFMMLTSFCVIGFADDVPTEEEPVEICLHENTHIERNVIQEADCYHVQIVEVKEVCDYCREPVNTYNEIGMEFKHGEIERVDLSTPPTCISDGWFIIREYCKLCGQNVGGATQPIAGVLHEINPDGTVPCYETRIEETPATCTKDGEKATVVWCNECNVEISRTTETIPATGHDWGEWKESEGKLVRVCNNCDETETQEIEKDSSASVIAKVIESIKTFFVSIRNFFGKLFKF